MIRILSKRERLILFAASAIIILGICFNFFLIPLLSRNASLNREIKVAREKLKKYTGLLSRKENIHASCAKISALSAEPGKEELSVAGMLSELENLAKGANLRIIDLRPQNPSQTASSLKESGVDLQTEGEIQGYLKFIYAVENSFLSLDIKRLQLKAKPNSENLEGNFSIMQISLND